LLFAGSTLAAKFPHRYFQDPWTRTRIIGSALQAREPDAVAQDVYSMRGNAAAGNGSENGHSTRFALI